MNLYLAALFTNHYPVTLPNWLHLNDREKFIVSNLPFVLESYHYVHKPKYVAALRSSGMKVFLDSGAYSAKSLGVAIDIDAYCDYCIRNQDVIRIEDGVRMFSVLDGIGDAELTYRNQKYMESKGARPLPCFHFGEDPAYLDYYVANYPYITIGGMAYSKAHLFQWLDRMWNDHMLDGAGRPKVKVHAFGVTAMELMTRYPWHSVDASTWVQNAGFGAVYTREFGPLAVSSTSPARHDAGRHIASLSDIERARFTAEFEREGFSLERLATIFQSRGVYSCLEFIKLNDDINRAIVERNYRFDCQQSSLTLF